MFNLDNFDLDIDDDFSSNIISKGADLRTESEVKREKLWEKDHGSIGNYSIHDATESSYKHRQTDSDVKINSNNFLDFSFIKFSGQMRQKRSCAQDEMPQKKRISNEGVLQRQFPGPAGLLPDKPFKVISDLALLTDDTTTVEIEDVRGKEKQIVFSQNSGSIFLDSSYQKLLSDFNLNESENQLNKYTIEWVKRAALSRGFQRKKIPFLGLVVHSVNQGATDSVLVLRDPTGEIQGNLHKEVWTDLGGKLRVGVALALKQVGVLITGVIRRQIYLNITMNNILALYSSSENESQVEVTTVNKISKLELMKSFEEWLAKPSKNILQKSSFNFPLLTTANEKRISHNSKDEIKNLKNTVGNLKDKSNEEKKKTGEKNIEVGLVDQCMGLVFTDDDFEEEIIISKTNSICEQVDTSENKKDTASKKTSSQVLSQAESLIFEEVLSGVNLDEFEI